MRGKRVNARRLLAALTPLAMDDLPIVRARTIVVPCRLRDIRQVGQ